MNLAETLSRYIGKYGRTVTLSYDGKTFSEPYRAFIQPLRYKNKMYLMGIRSRIGCIDQSHFLYIGPAEVNLSSLTPNARIKCGDKKYFIVKSEDVFLKDQLFYNWAVLRAVIEPEEEENA